MRGLDAPVIPDAVTPPGAGAPQPVVVMRDVGKRFGEEAAVEDLSFTLHAGEIFALIGPSGAGKTTAIRLMNGTYQPTTGAVTVFGQPAHRMDSRVRGSIGYLPQLFILYPNLSVKENIDFSASLYGMGWFSRRAPRRQVLEFVDLWEHRHKLARDISGGMQRRLELASSLIHDPKLLFLDEPTAGIDPILRAKFWDAFRALKVEGRSLFVTTQYVTEAEYCDQVAVLAHGRILVVDTPENLRLRAFGGEIIEVRGAHIGHATRPLFERVEGIRAVDTSVAGRARLVVDNAAAATPVVMELLRGANLVIEGMEQYRPNFDEVFVRLLEQEAEHV